MIDRYVIGRVMRYVGNHQARAAEILGLSRATCEHGRQSLPLRDVVVHSGLAIVGVQGLFIQNLRRQE